MRILAVANFFPWPPSNGGLIRLAKSVEALAEMGDVDLFSLYDQRVPDRTVPPNVNLSRVGTTPYPEVGNSLRWRAAWLARRGVPMEVIMRRSDKAPRRAFESWAAQRYDLVWFSTAATFEWLGRPRLGPTVIDLIDLESEKEEQRAAIMGAAPSSGGIAGRVRRSVAIGQARLNARDWNGLQRSVARQVDRVVLCSDLDVERSGLSNAEVIVNTYQRPARAVGRNEVGEPSSVLFQGTFDYAPNVDAAAWLAAELAPRIRARAPGAEIRLVGRTTPGVERLHRPPEVTVVGRVADMEPELARADIAVVPIRYGSGTRLKILESFAHRVPVVSTTMGAEGLDAQDGVHLLLADEPEAFAAACERLLIDPDLRKRIVDAAELQYLERYEWSVARAQLRALVDHVAGGGDPS